MQPLHISDDVRISDKYLGEQAESSYRIKSLLESGAKVVFGSDMPVANPDPLKGILAAHKRRYHLDKSEPSWNTSECISISEALHCYTSNAAYASYEENLKGTLEVGKLADFIGLPIDIEKADEDTLLDTTVNLTVLGGKVVYQGKN